MRRCAALGAIAGALVGAVIAMPAQADEACQAAVAAAFNKQRAARAFTMVSQLKAETGPVEIRLEYQPPDRMRQVVVAPNQVPLETTLYGTRAYSRQGEGPWEELMPAVAQTIIAQVREAVVEPPKDVGNFECLGTTALDGKDYLTYRSVEKPAPAGASGAPVMHRTIYVDPKTGLPAVNIVAGDKPGSEVIFRGTYDYPEKLEIEDHPDAPLVKMR